MRAPVLAAFLFFFASSFARVWPHAVATMTAARTGAVPLDSAAARAVAGGL